MHEYDSESVHFGLSDGTGSKPNVAHPVIEVNHLYR